MCRIFFHKMLRINHLRWFCGSVLGARLGVKSLFGLISCLFCLPFCACGGGEQGRSPAENAGYSCADSVVFERMQYSGMLRLGVSCGIRLADIRSVVGRDTLVKRFALVDSMRLAERGFDLGRLKRGREWKFATVLSVPLSRVVVLSSAQVGYMARLGVTGRIVGVGEGKYIADSSLYSRVVRGGATDSLPVAQLGNGTSLDYERLVAIKPDLVMTFATGGGEDDYARLEALGLPVMLTSEWQEDSPLAKAEWIRLYGTLFGAGSADSVFEQSRKSYEAIREGILAEPVPRPRVLAGMAYGGVWYAPGGRSYTAELIRDAGGRYLWEDDTTREMRLTLEEVLALSDSVDAWVNPGMFAKPSEILAVDPRVKGIKAFRDGRVCQNDARKGPGGGNDFYEGAVARPAELLLNVTECLYFGSDSLKRRNLEVPPYKWYRNIFKL